MEKVIVKDLPIITEGYKFFKEAIPDEKEIKRYNVGSFKVPGQIVDERLKHSLQNGYKEPSLFDFFPDARLPEQYRKMQITEEKFSEYADINDLSTEEWKIYETLCKFLQNKSQNITDPADKPSYYIGNIDADKVPGGNLLPYGKDKTYWPIIDYNAYEFCKELAGDRNIGGNEIKEMDKTIRALADKKVKFITKEKDKDGKTGRWVEYKIAHLDNLFKILNIDVSYGKDDIQEGTYKKEVLLLHPSIKRRLDNYYVEYPQDINEKIRNVYRNTKGARVDDNLKLFLLKEKSLKHYTTTPLALDKFYCMLNEEYWIIRHRKSLLKKQFQTAWPKMVEMGLLVPDPEKDASGNLSGLPYRIYSGSQGQDLIIFFINKDFK